MGVSARDRACINEIYHNCPTTASTPKASTKPETCQPTTKPVTDQPELGLHSTHLTLVPGNDRATRAVEWDDVADKNYAGEKMGKGPEGHQDSPEDVPGQREKSKVSKAFDVVAGPLQHAAAPGNSGSSDTADKLKEGLKGGNPAT